MFLRDLFHGKDVLNRVWRESGDFVEYTAKELRDKQLQIFDIYKDFLTVCRKNNLNVALVGGSALGAVRHKGFIPWDDDIDVAMPRNDYEKFKNIFETSLGDKYILNSPNYSEKVYTRFPKIFLKDGDEELFLDIFTIENAPNMRILQKIKGFICNVAMFLGASVRQYENRGSDLPEELKRLPAYKIKNVIGMIFSGFSSSQWFNFIDKLIQKKRETKYCTIPCGRKHYFGEILEKKIMFPFCEVDFEEEKSFAFSDLNGYLIHMYGENYMIPPDESKRERHYVKRKQAD